MSRLEETKEIYQNAVKKLQSNEQYFTDYLKYSGRFYKIPTAHAITLFENNPDATMLTDFDTWKKYGCPVRKNQRSSAVLLENDTQLKHYFDISQTTAKVIPFQWCLDKAITEEFLNSEAKVSGSTYRFRNMAAYIKSAAVKEINKNAEEIMSKFALFEMPQKDKKAFFYSVTTMVMATVAARCEHKSTYKYKTPDIPDLAALHMLKTKKDVVTLCDTVHQSAQAILSKMEKSITQIINIKRAEERHNEREQTGNEQANRGMEREAPQQQGGGEGAAAREREAEADMVRGGTGVVSPLHNGGEGQRNDSVQAEHGAELHLQRSVLGQDGESGDRLLRQEMAGIYGGELSERNIDNGAEQLDLWGNGFGDRQGSERAVQPAGQTVPSSEPTTHNIFGDSQVGENETVRDKSSGNGTGSASISQLRDNKERTAGASEEVSAVLRDTYSTINAVRLGDFYELFGKEAKIAAEKLDLTLTSRNGEPMVGFPQHALEQYENKFKAAGYSLKLWEDLQEYTAEKLISENAEKYILPKLSFDEQVAITDEFFSHDNAWHNVSKEIAEIAERYRNGEDIKKALTEVFFKNDINFSEWETVNNDAYKIQILTDDKGVDISCDNAKRHFSWEDVANLHWNYLKNTFKEIQLERIAEYPEVKEDVDRLIANMEENERIANIRQFAKEQGIPFSETYDDGEEEFDPYAADGSMSFEDFRKRQDLYRQDIVENNVGGLHNFTITDSNLGTGGLKTKCAANIAAIETLKQIEAENRSASPEEQETLSKYVGWGGIPQAFDSTNEKWSTEYAQLKELLTDKEYAAAKSSTLNAHYTSPEVINAIYKALDNMGFKKGKILEPSMGVGNFFGCMPEKMRDSELYGVELDSITGRIAKQLYPNADIQIKGFEKTDFPDNFFDVAIGNVPFGSYGVADKRYDKENFLIHDYFFAKTLDKVVNGGIVAFITSKGTLDKANPKVREYIAKRADLLGAIRLPNNAFKGNANTEVTSDIIFLQKREKPLVKLPDWVYLGETSDGIPINQYFVDNPEMVLGKMEYSTKMYGGKNTTCIPFEGEELSQQLDKAVSMLKTNIVLRQHRTTN